MQDVIINLMKQHLRKHLQWKFYNKHSLTDPLKNNQPALSFHIKRVHLSNILIILVCKFQLLQKERLEFHMFLKENGKFQHQHHMIIHQLKVKHMNRRMNILTLLTWHLIQKLIRAALSMNIMGQSHIKSDSQVIMEISTLLFLVFIQKHNYHI